MSNSQKDLDIFIIDDNEDLLSQCLEKNKEFGYKIKTENNFSKALEILTTPEVFAKIILFDLNSEKEPLKGFDLIKSFCEKNPTSTSILGVLIDKDELKNRKEALKYSISLFFQKPLDLDLIFSQIQSLLFQVEKRIFHILLLDEKDTFYKKLQGNTKNSSFEFHYLSNLEKLFEEIQHYHPDLLLLGNMGLSISQIEILTMIRSDFRYRFLPIILLLIKEDLSIIKSAITLDIQGFFDVNLESDKLLHQLILFFKKQEISKPSYLKDPILHFYQKEAISHFFETIITLKSTILTFAYLRQVNQRAISEEIRKKLWQKFCSFLSLYFGKKEIIASWNGYQLIILFLNLNKDQTKIILHHFFSKFEKDFQNESFLKVKAAILSCPEDESNFVSALQKSQEMIRVSENPNQWEILSLDKKLPDTNYVNFKNILLICADIPIEKVLKYHFELKGGKVFSFSDGLKGFEWLVENLFEEDLQLILIDDSMIGEHPLVILRKFQDYIGQKTPLFFLSSFNQELETIVAEQPSINVILKPFSLTFLISSIEKSLSR